MPDLEPRPAAPLRDRPGFRSRRLLDRRRAGALAEQPQVAVRLISPGYLRIQPPEHVQLEDYWV